MTGLLDDVRRGAAEVAARARWVEVDDDRLAVVADELALPAGRGLDDARDPELDMGCPAATVAFVVTWDAVNFGSGWWPHVRKLPGLSGARTMHARLRARFAAAGPLPPAELASMTPEACAHLFGQDLVPPVAALLAEFAGALRDLGTLLLGRYDGSFEALVEEAGGSAEQLVAALLAMPRFRDVPRHHGVDVPLLKRAQITTADLARAFAGRGPGRFHDLDRLTVFADNLVPHVLRVDGVLRVHPDLVRRIDRGELLRAGSEEETELRAVAVHAVERMVLHLQATGAPATAAALDLELWARGQRPRYKAVPRHRARTVWY